MTITTAVPSDPRNDDILAEIRQLLAECCSASNKHERAMVAIEALIIAGVWTRPDITRSMRSLAFDYRHANIILKTMTGAAPYHRWRVDEQGRYSLADDD